MIYAAAIIAAIVLIGGILWLLGRGAERRERQHRHRRGILAGDGVSEGGAGYSAAFGGDMADGGGCDSGGGGGGCD